MFIQGTHLTPLLYDILSRFRSHVVALTSDVEKAFLKINVNENDRDYLRFLWLDNIFSDQPKVGRNLFTRVRNSHPELFLGKGVLKILSKFTGEYPCRIAISVKLQSNFIEIALRYGRSPVNLLHIFRTPFLKKTFEGLLL